MKNDLLLALSGSLLLPGMLSAQHTENKQPNIVLFVVDDLGTDDAGCYGNPVIKTPGLDYLATQGTRFTHAFCTSSSCSASRSVILTGLYNHATGHYGHTHGEFHFSAFDHIRSLPMILDSAGYRTMHVGKLHVAPRSVFKFDKYHPSKEEYPDEVWKSIDEAPYYTFANSRAPETLAEDMRSFIADTTGSPFFLYFCTFEPHSPFRRQGSDTIYPQDVIVPSHLPDIQEVREKLAIYYMSMQRADKGLKHLIEVLKETGKWDNTVILFVSDNGRPFPNAKTNLYDPGIRLPFVFRNPYQNTQGIVTDAMVNYADITPTLLDFAGVDLSHYKFHGRSFRSQLDKTKSIGFDTVYASHTFHETQMYYPMRMIRDRNYKFIWNLAFEQPYPLGVGAKEFAGFIERNNLKYIGKRKVSDYLQRPQYELYDLNADTEEVNNLAYKPKYKAMMEYYIKRLYSFQHTTGDIWDVYQDYEAVRKLVK